MNFYGLEILDEITFFILTLFFGIIIVISWMSTKVDCDFRHVRTIILEANDQIIHNYTNSVNQTNIISVEEMLSSDFGTNTLDNGDSNFGDLDNIEDRDNQQHSRQRIDSVDIPVDAHDSDKEPCSSSNYQRLFDTKSRGQHPNSLSRNIIKMKIKYLDDREKWVFTDIKQTIYAFKRDNFSEEMRRDLNVRLIYNGQELKENDMILEQYGLVNNCTVHCLVTQPRSNLPTTPVHDPNMNIIGNDRSDIEIGGLMFPLFGVLLTVFWYCRICYRHYFNVVTTFALIGMTIIYMIACITCFNFGTTSYPGNSQHRAHIHRVVRANAAVATTVSSSATQTMPMSASSSSPLSFTSTLSSF